MADMYDSPQERDTFVDRWIAELGRVVLDAMHDFLTTIREAILGTSGPPDTGDWPPRSAWSLIVDNILLPIIQTIIGESTSAGFDSSGPAADYTVRIRLRLTRVMDDAREYVRTVMNESAQSDETVDVMRDRVASILGDDDATQRLRDQVEELDETLAAGGLSREERADLTTQRRILADRIGVDDGRWANHADRVAHTETVAAHNYGVETEAIAETPDSYRQWWAMQDNRTRPAHRVAHRQTVPMGEPFRVGGVDMLYPGDPRAPAHLTINCRCLVRILDRSEGVRSASEYDANRTNLTDGDGVVLDDDGNSA